MSNFVMLALCLLAGLALRLTARVPDNAHLPINAVVLHLSLPALTLTHLRHVSFDASHLVPVLMPWLLFGVGAAVFWLGGRWMRLPAPTVGALTLVGGFGNTSFVGLPMIESLHVRVGMALGLLIDHLGSYLALSTVGRLCLLGANLEMPQRVSVIEAAMPPMIGAGVVAAQARLDAPLVSLMIGLGIPLGLVTASMWHLAFGWLARGGVI